MGQSSKATSDQKWRKGCCAKRRISFLLLSQDCLQGRAQSFVLLHRFRGTRLVQQHNEVTIPTLKHRETEAKKKHKDNNPATSNRLRDLPDWSEEFTENLEGTEVPASRETAANTSQDSDSERPAKVESRRRSVHTHFPTDRNCEVCKRAKMTRAPCRRRTGDAVLRAENFGDLMTTNHKVLSEGCESRNNHRNAVVVQDSATQSYPCKPKLLRRRKGVYEHFSSRRESRKSFTLTIPWNLANLVKMYHGIVELRHLIDPRRKGTAERAVRREKEGTFAVLLQTGLVEKLVG